jgi:outer membrane protein TolC
MCGSRSLLLRLRRCLLGSVIAPGLLVASADTWAGPPDSQPATQLSPASANAAAQGNQPAAPVADKKLDLAACKALALQKQPTVAAAHASLAAAIARQQALENLCVPTFLQRDLPKRRQQASLGVTVAQAGVLQAEIDTTYAVEYAYISYLYALEQDRLARTILEELPKIQEGFKAPVEGDKDRQGKQAAVARIDALTYLARGRQQEAIVGIERALSLLREAIGLDDCPLSLAEQNFPEDCRFDRQQVVHLALSRRPEITQAATGTEVTDLEVSAQHARRFALSVFTFAAGSDIHARPLPTDSFNPGYRPGAIGIEMPVTINGKRGDRVEQAKIYNDRAHSVLEKTQNLIRLETEQAYLRFKEAKKKLELFEEGQRRARRSRSLTRLPEQSGDLSSYLDVARLATDLRFEVNRARYELRVALIALERATAGGFCTDAAKAHGEAGNAAKSSSAPTMIGDE